MSAQDSERVPVAVIGAGPVGLTAALLLADAGIRVLVVEKALQPGDLPRAISLQDESFRTFEQLGVADALKAESLLETGSRYVGLNGKLLAEAKPVPSRIGQPSKSQFDQPILEDLLFNRAVAHPLVDMRLGMSAEKLEMHANMAVLTIAGADDQQHEIHADWLIGADGGKSFTRAALGIKLVGSTQPQRWLVIDLLNETREYTPFAEFQCDGERPHVIVPGIDGRLRIEFMLFDGEKIEDMVRPERIQALVVPKFRAQLDEADIRRATVYVAHQRVAEHFRKGRAFLIGDASHLMPPFAGQGLNAGIRDANNLAWKLIEVIRGGAGDALLDTFEVERREHSASMVKISARVGAVVMATNPIATMLRDAAVRCVNLVPKARTYLANMRFISPPNYSNGAVIHLGKEAPKLPGAPLGMSVSQPQVTDAAGLTAGLDRFLGTGWAVLGIEADPSTLSNYWSRISAARLQLGASSPIVHDNADITVLQEVEPVFTGQAVTPARGVFVLVRPDRYVAAVFTAAEEPAVVAGMRGYVDDDKLVAQLAKSE